MRAIIQGLTDDWDRFKRYRWWSLNDQIDSRSNSKLSSSYIEIGSITILTVGQMWCLPAIPMLIARKRATRSIFGVDAQTVRNTTRPSSKAGRRRRGRVSLLSSVTTTVSWDKLAGTLCCPTSPTIW